MKLISLSLMLALLGSSLSALAARAVPPECTAPVAACKAAGFKVGAHKKGDKEGADMGLWVDCVDAVADGKKTVAGVETAAAQACKAAIKALKAK